MYIHIYMYTYIYICPHAPAAFDRLLAEAFRIQGCKASRRRIAGQGSHSYKPDSQSYESGMREATRLVTMRARLITIRLGQRSAISQHAHDSVDPLLTQLNRAVSY